MRYRIILTKGMAEELKKHLLTDRSKEQMAVTLCGVNHFKNETRLLARHLILFPPEAFQTQSSAYLELDQAVQRQILTLAASEGLSQIDWHSHPGDSSYIGFSGTDDHNESKLAAYLHDKIPGTLYGSVVVNRNVFDTRIWETREDRVQAKPVESIRWGDFEDVSPFSSRRRNDQETTDEQYSRQVAAFGKALQARLRNCKIGIIGVGGLGGIVVEMLSRLGCDNWVLVDDDVVEVTNLNRLPGSSRRDAYYRTLKVRLTQRNIATANPYAKTTILPLTVTNKRVIDSLKSCDLLIVATDNNSSRLIANRISVQYLIPLIHIGVNIEVNDDRTITDMSGEYVFPPLGEWCLQCAGIIDGQMAGWELADEGLRSMLRERGYVKDTPAPAVYHLNGVIAALAVAEIHNFVFPYKPVHRYLTYDELKGELLPLEVSNDVRCTICDNEEGYLGLGDLEPLPDYEAKPKAIPSSVEIDEGAEDTDLLSPDAPDVEPAILPKEESL
ncbi:MAG: Sulfur carrier protein ThiS adenylyltransferase [Syntrophorhabdus sp. PtaU1.Bin002]|nr:MAG: Sulfur carrier protein ThiS adenylyltransferase [Syntrophorhabdus sp. PtaU1.Bin002]